MIIKTNSENRKQEKYDGIASSRLEGIPKIDGKFYLVTSTDTAYVPNFTINIFRMTLALTKGFDVTSEK